MSNRSFPPNLRAALGASLALALAACASTGTALSQDVPAAELPPAQAPTYADLVDHGHGR